MKAPAPERTSAGSGIWLPLALVVVALAVRLYRLGAESIWLDEATSLFLARMDVRSLVAWTSADIHPPLYYLLLHYWRAFGESEVALRGLSVLAGLAAVPLLYELGRSLFDRRAGAAAGLFLALAPLHVWYSQQARMYTFLMLWVLLASYALVRALTGRDRGWWVGYALAMALGYYTHYYSSLALLFHGVVVIGWAATQRRWSAAPAWLAAVAGSGVLFLPWLPTMWAAVSSGGGGWVAQGGTPGVRAIWETFVAFTVGSVHHLLNVWLRRLIYAVVLALLAVGAWSALSACGERRDRERMALGFSALYVAVPLGVAWLVSQVKPMYAERFLLAFVPGFCLLVGRGVAAMPRQWARWAAAGIVAALLGYSLWTMTAVPQNDDWRSAAAFIREGSRSSDVAVYYPGWNQKPAEYYLPSAPPSAHEFPVPIGREQVSGFVEPALVGYRRAWLVWSVGHYGDREGNVKRFFDERYHLVSARQFIGPIGVALYDLSAGP